MIEVFKTSYLLDYQANINISQSVTNRELSIKLSVINMKVRKLVKHDVYGEKFQIPKDNLT